MAESTIAACPGCNRMMSATAHFCSFCGTAMSCGRCGTRAGPGDAFCASCGTRLDTSWQVASSTTRYAGFWKRFAAYSIDSLVLFAAALPIALILVVAQVVPLDGSMSDSQRLLVDVISLGGSWLYFALMESSSKQATFGKMALGLKVTDENGQRLSLGRASGRYFAKILSGLSLGVGYLMAGFTKRKQALHDKVANTYVVANVG